MKKQGLLHEKGRPLKKGERFHLHEQGQAPDSIVVGLGWFVPDLDLDISCLLCGEEGELQETINHNKMASECGSIQRSFDWEGGAVDKDGERVMITLSTLHPDIHKLVFVVSMLGAHLQDDPSFFKNAYIRLLKVEDSSNEPQETELLRYELNKGTAGKSLLVPMQLIREKEGWVLEAVRLGRRFSRFEFVQACIFKVCFFATIAALFGVFYFSDWFLRGGIVATWVVLVLLGTAFSHISVQIYQENIRSVVPNRKRPSAFFRFFNK